MEFKTEKVGDVIVLELMMETLDAGNAKRFKAAVTPILESNQNVVFNMGRVKFLDSSGCGTLLSCLRQLSSRGGDLKLFGIQKPVMTLFELVRMHRVVEMFETQEAAVKAF